MNVCSPVRMPAVRSLILTHVFAASLLIVNDRCCADDVATALRNRYAAFPPMRVTVDWRAFRCDAGSDPLQRSAWRTAPEKSSRFEVDICYPDFRLRMTDLPRGDSERAITTGYSWVGNQLAALTHFPDAPSSYLLLDNRRVGSLKGRVVLTPLELEFFDTKAACRDLFAGQAVLSSSVAGNIVSVEWANPQIAGTIVRGRFDASRGWVPTWLEQFAPAAEGRQEMSYSMIAIDWRLVEGTWLVSEAIIVNRNPNVLRDEVSIQHYQITEAEPVPALKAADLTIIAPSSNVQISDHINNRSRSIDSDGVVLFDRQISEQDLKVEREARQAQSDELGRLLREKQRRPVWGFTIIGAAAAIVLGAWFIVGRRGRKRSTA